MGGGDRRAADLAGVGAEQVDRAGVEVDNGEAEVRKIDRVHTTGVVIEAHVAELDACGEAHELNIAERGLIRGLSLVDLEAVEGRADAERAVIHSAVFLHDCVDIAVVVGSTLPHGIARALLAVDADNRELLLCDLCELRGRFVGERNPGKAIGGVLEVRHNIGVDGICGANDADRSGRGVIDPLRDGGAGFFIPVPGTQTLPVAVILVSPSPMAVTKPCCVTVATVSSAEAQVSSLAFAFHGFHSTSRRLR